MIFLVDFENTHASGFDGYYYLTEQDTLVVYYSDENSALQKGVVEDLKEKAVHVRMVKLLKQHSNALDMYIASTTGMFLDTGEKICIVSKDKGYAAVRDFWHSLRGAEILLGETIEECFLHSVANDDERIRRAKERSQKVQLIDAFETTNNVPTRPTLSHRNNYRRRKNHFLDVNSHLEPVELLPNPLAKEDVSYASLVEEENDGEHFTVDYSTSIKEEKIYPDEKNAISVERKESSSASPEESNWSERKEILSSQREGVETEVSQHENKREEKIEENHSEFANRIYPKTEKKSNGMRASNQIQYIYDPILKRMKRVDVEEVGEEDISEANTEKSMNEKAQKASNTKQTQEMQEELIETAEESHSTEQAKERQRHHNRRRRRSNAKKDNGTQDSGLNYTQENTKELKVDSKEIVKDNSTETAKDNSKKKTSDNTKSVLKEEAANKLKKEKVKEGKKDKLSDVEKEIPQGAKKESTKDSLKPEKERKAKKQDKAIAEEKNDKPNKPVKEKKTAVKKDEKAGKAEAKTDQAKSVEKSSKSKVEEKSEKLKTEDKTMKENAAEKPRKSKVANKKSNTKADQSDQSGKTKQEKVQPEEISSDSQKKTNSRRGRKKKEEV